MGRGAGARSYDNRFVRDKCPSVPVPEVLHSWIDTSITRSFIVLKRVYARTLNDAWPDLSPRQQQSIADEVAQHCSTLARLTSLNYQSVSGYGVLDYWLMGYPPSSNPTWLPMTLGPFSSIELKAYMAKISSEPVPEFNNTLLFYHSDLGPTNILVANDGNSVAAIIDWEAAAYFPSFWVATKPASRRAFHLGGHNVTNKDGWSKSFVYALESRGFICLDTAYISWK